MVNAVPKSPQKFINVQENATNQKLIDKLQKLNEISQQKIKEQEDEINRLKEVERQLEKQLERRRISDYNKGDTLDTISDVDLNNMIIKKCAGLRYRLIDVKTVNVKYAADEPAKPSRKILIEKGKINILKFISVFFSATFVNKSLVRRTINASGLKSFIIGSAALDKLQIEEAKKDMLACFEKCYSIRIYIPNDLSHNGEIQLISESNLVDCSISAGTTLRDKTINTITSIKKLFDCLSIDEQGIEKKESKKK